MFTTRLDQRVRLQNRKKLVYSTVRENNTALYLSEGKLIILSKN